MIVLLHGISCSGKSTILERLSSRLPEDPNEDIFEPLPFWKCREYGNILHVETYPIKYPPNQVFTGTEVITAEKTIYDGESEVIHIPKYQEFCNGVAVGYEHTLIECDMYWRSEEIQWVLDNHESQVFLLSVDSKEELRRQNERHSSPSEEEKNLCKLQINNIQSNINLMGRLNVRENNTIESSLKIEDEIYAKVI